jgi:small subunit ribosomal protein S16
MAIGRCFLVIRKDHVKKDKGKAGHSAILAPALRTARKHLQFVNISICDSECGRRAGSCIGNAGFLANSLAFSMVWLRFGLQSRTALRYNNRLFPSSNFIGKIMVVIRLARGGAKKRPFFNIVATDSRNRRDGRFIERIGFYNPVAAGGEVPFRVAQDRLAYWQGVGAQLSPTVARLVSESAKAAA